jgi:hypothetical protein
MATHLPSISSTKRVAACQGSEVLQIRVNETGESAERGNTIHGFICDVADRGVAVKDALKKVHTDHHRVCKKLDVQAVVGDLTTNRRAEVAYALDLESEMVRELGQYLGRAYPTTSPLEAKGTLDWTGQKADGLWKVKDVKTGLYVGPPGDDWQLRFFSACIMYTYVVSRVEGEICYVKDDGSVECDSHVFTAKEMLSVVPDLTMIRRSLIDAHAAFAANGRVEVSPGDHCRYCPSFDVCPAQHSLASSLIKVIPALHLAYQCIRCPLKRCRAFGRWCATRSRCLQRSSQTWTALFSPEGWT